MQQGHLQERMHLCDVAGKILVGKSWREKEQECFCLVKTGRNNFFLGGWWLGGADVHCLSTLLMFLMALQVVLVHQNLSWCLPKNISEEPAGQSHDLLNSMGSENLTVYQCI